MRDRDLYERQVLAVAFLADSGLSVSDSAGRSLVRTAPGHFTLQFPDRGCVQLRCDAEEAAADFMAGAKLEGLDDGD